MMTDIDIKLSPIDQAVTSALNTYTVTKVSRDLPIYPRPGDWLAGGGGTSFVA